MNATVIQRGLDAQRIPRARAKWKMRKTQKPPCASNRIVAPDGYVPGLVGGCPRSASAASASCPQYCVTNIAAIRTTGTHRRRRASSIVTTMDRIAK